MADEKDIETPEQKEYKAIRERVGMVHMMQFQVLPGTGHLVVTPDQMSLFNQLIMRDLLMLLNQVDHKSLN